MVNAKKEEDRIIIRPDKKYPKGHELEITITPDMAVFHIDTDERGSGPNAQLDYQEFIDLLETLKLSIDLDYTHNLIKKIKGEK